MSGFTTELNVQFIDGKYWVLLSPFSYAVGGEDSGEVVFVHAGFKTDFASIPRFAWPLIGHPTGKYGKAAVIHDYLYQCPHAGNLHGEPPWDRKRRRCDQIFLEGMKVLGVPWWKRTVMYSSVRVGGRWAWHQNRKREKAE